MCAIYGTGTVRTVTWYKLRNAENLNRISVPAVCQLWQEGPFPLGTAVVAWCFEELDSDLSRHTLGEYRCDAIPDYSTTLHLWHSGQSETSHDIIGTNIPYTRTLLITSYASVYESSFWSLVGRPRSRDASESEYVPGSNTGGYSSPG